MVLGLVLAVITLTSFGLNIRPVAAGFPSAIWSADFESGDQSQFSGGPQETGGAKVVTSSSVQYEGTYSGYYYYAGPPGGEKRNAYPAHYLSGERPSKFLVELWVYVPSNVDGQHVTLTDWVSFATLWVNEGSWRTGECLTVDSNSKRQLNLWMGMFPAEPRVLYQRNPVQWPFDRWFKIGIQGDLRPGTANSRITVLQDNVAIIDYVGNLGEIYDGLDEMHFGLYMSADQGAFAVYNDAIVVRPATTLQVHKRS